MKRYLKSTLLLLTALIMTLLLPAGRSAAEEGTALRAGDLVYEIRTDAGTGESYAVITDGTPVRELSVPAEIDGYPVREIAAGFTGATKGWTGLLEKLTVAEGITAIGENAFAHCTLLREVSLPASLVSAGEMAFADIAAEGLTLPENAEKASSGFWYCSAIRKDETGEWEYALLGDGSAVITSFFSITRSVKDVKLVIPDEVDGIPVTMVANVPLGKADYTKARKIRQVTLPKGLKAVEHLAFKFFESMTQISLPAGLTSIGFGAFMDCRKLTGIKIPEGVTRIGDEAFRGCRSLAFPALPNTLEKIGKKTFYWCKKLNSVKLPESIRTVEEMAFADSGIRTLTLNEGLETIGEKAFSAHKIREIVLPASLRTIGNAAFDPEDNTELAKVTFKSASTEPGVGVFGYDDGWAAYVRKAQKRQETANADDYDKADANNWIDFYRDADNYGQKTLTVVCFPGSRADRLYQHHVTKDYLQTDSAAAVTAPGERVLQAGLYGEDDLVYALIIPEGVEEIADYAFAGLKTLNQVTLPGTLSRIGAHAFEDCTGLKEVIVQGKTMEEIGEAAFRGCTELKKITIPEGVTAIGSAAFEKCRNLKKVVMPKNGIRSIGDRAFAECTALTELSLNAGLESIGTEAFYKCGLSVAQIPDSVTLIGTRAFYLSSLTRIKFPAVMEEIPEYVCAYSTKLNKLTLPKEMKRIGKGAFMQCPVDGFTLPEGLLSIEEKAFAFDNDVAQQRYGRNKTMARLRNLKLPASLETIGREAFTANDTLTSITFAKDGRLEEIGENAFSLCFQLKSITLPDSLRKIGDGAFRKCVQMNKADLGKGITELGDNMFDYCLKLTSLTAPESLTKIGENILNTHHSKLKVTCPEGSAMQSYMERCYPEVKIVFPKK